jgi:hypothetical protein
VNRRTFAELEKRERTLFVKFDALSPQILYLFRGRFVVENYLARCSISRTAFCFAFLAQLMLGSMAFEFRFEGLVLHTQAL